MAIVSKHLSANLRLTNEDNEFVSSYQRFDPNVTGQQVNVFMDALSMIRGTGFGNAFLTVTTELTREA